MKFSKVASLLALCVAPSLSFAFAFHNQTNYDFSVSFSGTCAPATIRPHSDMVFSTKLLMVACATTKTCRMEVYAGNDCLSNHAMTISISHFGQIKGIEAHDVRGKPMAATWTKDNLTIIQPTVCWPRGNC